MTSFEGEEVQNQKNSESAAAKHFFPSCQQYRCENPLQSLNAMLLRGEYRHSNGT